MIDLTAVYLLIPLIAGMLTGYFMRKKKHIDLGKVTSGIIVLLIFAMGFRIGSDDKLLASMPKTGVNAVVLVTLVVCFSAVFLKVSRRLVRLD